MDIVSYFLVMFTTFMYPGNGIFHPFSDIDSVVADALKVFGDHQQVQNRFWIAALVLQALNELLADFAKQFVNFIIILYDLLGQVSCPPGRKLQHFR